MNQIETIQKDWLTTAEAAERLGMTDSGVRRLISTGRLPALRFGARSWIIKEADMQQIKRSKAGRPRKAKAGDAAREPEGR